MQNNYIKHNIAHLNLQYKQFKANKPDRTVSLNFIAVSSHTRNEEFTGVSVKLNWCLLKPAEVNYICQSAFKLYLYLLQSCLCYTIHLYYIHVEIEMYRKSEIHKYCTERV